MTVFIVAGIIILVLTSIYLGNSFQFTLTESVSPKDVSLIPKIIIQLGNTKPDLKSTLRTMNKDFTFIDFNDDAIASFLNSTYPRYYSSYQRLPLIILKIDYFRYIAIYHYGGYYFDRDVDAVASLDAAIAYKECVFPLDTVIGEAQCQEGDSAGYNFRFREFCTRKGQPKVPYLLGQYAFAAKPRNPFLLLLIETIHSRVDEYARAAKLLVDPAHDYNFVYKATGPDFVTAVLVNNNYTGQVHVLRKTVSSWWLWRLAEQLYLGSRDRSKANPYRYFGNYAIHHNSGSWKSKSSK